MCDEYRQLTLGIQAPIDPSKTDPNPMVKHYGLGPADMRCKHCAHLTKIQPGQNRYYKCLIRGVTHGPGTDHRTNWSSCSLFEPNEKERAKIANESSRSRL